MTAFYNEPDPYAAQWLENLIAAGHIAPGIVDHRPIQEIEAWELAGFTQCHFFAGIGVWSLALRSAGWSDDRPIWTGSCPCQPFSDAGQRKGISDERHLWPFWSKLIEQCKPAVFVGEQVASKDGLGWLDLVSADVERAGYAFGASDLCAAGFEGTHIRQRLCFVGLGNSSEQSGKRFAGSLSLPKTGSTGSRCADGRHDHRHSDASETGGLAHDESKRWDGIKNSTGTARRGSTENFGAVIGLAHHHHHEGLEGRAGMPECGNQLPVGAASLDGRLEHSDLPGQHSRRKQPICDEHNGPDEKSSSSDQRKIASRWLDVDWLLCRNPAGEPSWRPVEPGTFPLDNAVAGRMGKLRAFGNALDKETATNFCEVVREISDDLRFVKEFDL